jgi:hypothetical protein
VLQGAVCRAAPLSPRDTQTTHRQPSVMTTLQLEKWRCGGATPARLAAAAPSPHMSDIFW